MEPSCTVASMLVCQYCGHVFDSLLGKGFKKKKKKIWALRLTQPKMGIREIFFKVNVANMILTTPPIEY